LLQAASPEKGAPDFAAALGGLDRPDAPGFNLLLLAGAASILATDPATLGALYRSAAATARRHFAQLIIEAPDTAPDYAAWRTSLGLNDPDMAAWAPWPMAQDGRLVAPGAAIAGAIARTDNAVGVWQAPAGANAALNGLSSRAISDDQLQAMNMAHINSLRQVQGATAIWGARTLSDDPEWLYLPVRRLARWIEASVADGLGWTVFEPNAAPLWQGVARDVTAFLDDVWRQGGLVGSTPSQAYSVRCGLNSTMSQNDVLNGILRVEIAFAPLRPAEFIIIRIEQTVQLG
jgi:phage tail sheath protein FI